MNLSELEPMYGLRQWVYQKDPTQESDYAKITWQQLVEWAENEGISDDTLVGWIGLPFGFRFGDIEAEYLYAYDGVLRPAYSLDELNSALSEGRLSPEDTIWGRRLPEKGIPFASLPFMKVEFSPLLHEFFRERLPLTTTILAGPNNSGKSLILKRLKFECGPTGNFLACNRFFHLDNLSHATYSRAQYIRRHETFVAQLISSRNSEDYDYPIAEILGRMSDLERNRVFEVCSEMLGEEFSMDQIDPNNSLSPYQINVGGESLRLASTGTRLLMMIVAACLDRSFEFLLIDEPEIGLSPRLQSRLAHFLLNRKQRQQYLPHVKHIFIATHSHLFLDRSHISNNFIVSKSAAKVSLIQIELINSFHNLQFNLLGNDLQSLFLPSAIVLVEGETDQRYIETLFHLHCPDSQISVIQTGGEGEIPRFTHIISRIFGNMVKSPYRNRVFVLLDQSNSSKLQGFTNAGIPLENVAVLNRNGIEYYYPAETLCDVFGIDATDPADELDLDDHRVQIRGIQKRKGRLSQEVLPKLTKESRIPGELWDKLISKVIKTLMS